MAAVLFVVPLIMGGRIALGQLILVCLAVWVAVCWCVRQCLVSRAAWIRTPAEPLLLAAVALVGLQLVAFPPSVLNLVSANLQSRLPLWASGGDASATLGVWSTLSLTPVATRHALIVLVAFTLIFLTVVQRIREVEDVERVIGWMAVSTLGMAGFALVQHFAGNGKYFWFYEYPFSEAKRTIVGSFTNRNHFADFMAVGIGPLIWWVCDAWRQNGGKTAPRSHGFGWRPARPGAKRGLRVLALGFVVFVTLMSLSRGGIMAASVAVFVCMLILYRGSLIGGKTAAAVAGAGLLVAAGLCIHGYESLANRLDDFGSIETLDQRHLRRELWLANAAGIRDYPWAGTGLGSHREICPIYLKNNATSQQVEFTHAENGYLQVCLETGVPGLLLALTAIGLCVSWCLRPLRGNRSRRNLLCLAAIAAGLCASFVHSLADFVWYVPGCMTGVVVLAACAARMCQLSGQRLGRPTPLLGVSRVGWLTAVLCLASMGCFMVRHSLMACRAEPSWHRYLGLSKALRGREGTERRDTLVAMAEELSAVVRRDPDHARAHTRLAAVHLKLFDHSDDPEVTPLGVRQVREAVLASNFDSSQAMHDWLRRAFGRRREHLVEALKHARRAVALCPLQGEAYLYLADLAFLEGPASPGKAAYVDQALKVRPFDGVVLFAAGQEAILLGNTEAALAYWRASFHCGRDHQQRLLALLAAAEPAALFLDGFQPDLPALRLIAAHYQRLDRPDEARLVWEELARKSESQAAALQGEGAADLWMEAAAAHDRLCRLAESLRCLRIAARQDSFRYDVRRALGRCLFKMQEYDEAEKHLSWCWHRAPQDKKLRAELEAAIDARLRVSMGNHGAFN